MSAENKPLRFPRLQQWLDYLRERASGERIADRLILVPEAEYPIGDIADEMPAFHKWSVGIDRSETELLSEADVLVDQLDDAIRNKIALHPDDVLRNGLNRHYVAEFSMRGRVLPLELMSISRPGYLGDLTGVYVETNGVVYSRLAPREKSLELLGLPKPSHFTGGSDLDRTSLFVSGIRNVLYTATKIHVRRA